MQLPDSRKEYRRISNYLTLTGHDWGDICESLWIIHLLEAVGLRFRPDWVGIREVPPRDLFAAWVFEVQPIIMRADREFQDTFWKALKLWAESDLEHLKFKFRSVGQILRDERRKGDQP